jgi:hypothetical protein
VLIEQVRRLVDWIIHSSNLVDDRLWIVSESGDIETIISTLSEDEQKQLIEELWWNVESWLLNVIWESFWKDNKAISIFMKSIMSDRQKWIEFWSWRAYLNLWKVIDNYLLANDYLKKALARAPENKKDLVLHEVWIRYLELKIINENNDWKSKKAS